MSGIESISAEYGGTITDSHGNNLLAPLGPRAMTLHRSDQGDSMSQYLPPKIQGSQQAKAHRANVISGIVWLLAIPPIVFAVMAFGYSDQAPAFLRNVVVQLDTLFGQPVWWLIGPGK